MKICYVLLLILVILSATNLASQSQEKMTKPKDNPSADSTTHPIPNEEAVRGLILLMDSTEYRAMMQAPLYQKINKYTTFWKSQDPTPDTGLNELEQEYLDRLKTANQYFGGLPGKTDGWQCDQGRTLIIYGKPNTIENLRTDTNDIAKYEIWIYHHLNKRFVFKQDSAHKPYKLITED